MFSNIQKLLLILILTGFNVVTQLTPAQAGKFDWLGNPPPERPTRGGAGGTR